MHYGKQHRQKNAFGSLTERLVAAMLTPLSTMGFAHDLPYALGKNDKLPYGIRCPRNPNARTPSHPRQWQSPLFRRDFNASPGTASPNGIHGDRSAWQGAYAELGEDAQFFQRAASFAPRRCGPKASGLSCSAEYRDGSGTHSQMLGR